MDKTVAGRLRCLTSRSPTLRCIGSGAQDSFSLVASDFFLAFALALKELLSELYGLVLVTLLSRHLSAGAAPTG